MFTSKKPPHHTGEGAFSCLSHPALDSGLDAGGLVVALLGKDHSIFVTGGLGVAAGMMVAVGFAMLLKMMWSKKMCVYYFLGFLLVAYLNLPILAVAFFGVILCVILYFEGNFKMNKAAPEASEEEELFND